MKIVCAETVLLAQEAFSLAGKTVVIPDREITRDDLFDADALIVRSKTKINADLISGTPVKFVGTATAGTDHIDSDALGKRGIYWCAAPGCNANSVSEYLVAALLVLRRRHGYDLEGKTIGVIGCGNVGSRVVKKCHALGMNVLRNDPPLAAVSADPDFLPLEHVLAESDIVTLHIPLVKTGPWPTERLADYLFFEQLKPGAIFINAARGSVCDYDALLAAKAGGAVAQTVIDVWNPEPAFRPDVLKLADLASPHIAGHSYEGKLNGTIACYNELCNFFELRKSWDIAASLPQPDVPHIEIDCNGRSDEEVLYEIIGQIYDIETDDRLIRDASVQNEVDRARNFDALRKSYRTRREFKNTELTLNNAATALRHKAKALGFIVREA
ncbi:4-phosphoerythronate dehydrogenase [Pontiella sulfatireligans]|uniref:Erythronate-4-phosphate dehydrogenase n=1 Tax=Pontiella sulfatireligans TaxID=2750658 RepID=A0A6C2UP60_9BACT|nr:4-phosphoerythronate dehydrogenase [Pontiella sulfatireligans]VGO21104.1 Erythronate-4-phosphate dehydrogenase [Pontiella sulfatireligans]